MQKSNKLIAEKSPYLLQHAHHPVHWFPWGEEAFQKAEKEDKPVFLSIGYSTCHWCHVMAHESFENSEIAEILNRFFISVKVDREERPDIDAVYMAACHAFGVAGGWPLTVMMTPAKAPFFVATYLPPHTRYGMQGLDEVLFSIASAWKTERKTLFKAGKRVQAFLQSQAPAAGEVRVAPQALVEAAVSWFSQQFDEQNGGFGPAPKFPSAHNLLFLLRSKTGARLAEKTLIQIYRGGITDHIGGGVSRYSTDEQWLVPHFEKMLYDNAMLAYAYLEAYAAADQALFAVAAERILSYLQNELADPSGGFYCGQDADSDGVEGKYYVFLNKEIDECLGLERGKTFRNAYGFSEGGNFDGANIPNLLENAQYARAFRDFREELEKLYAYRLRRFSLHKDDKILFSWNGLAIAAFAKAYGVLQDQKYLQAAERAQAFLFSQMVKDGVPYVRYREGNLSGKGMLDDYAFVCFGLLELYAVTFDVTYLARACRLADGMVRLFFDHAAGGFYFYAADAEQLLFRPKEFFDGALPSGNSVAAFVLQRLFRLTGEKKWGDLWDLQMRFLLSATEGYPQGTSFALLSFGEQKDLVCVFPSPEDLAALRKVAALHPELAIVVKTRENASELAKTAPFTGAFDKKGFYLCENGACRAPAESLENLEL